MEGPIARWYARTTACYRAEFEALAGRIAQDLMPGASVLEIAPGPGYLAVELAKRGFQVTGVDISRAFVEVATENAARAGVAADFRRGDAAALPFADSAFDFLVCRAAFKNFANPAGALSEMHRTLRANSKALIIDMRRDASDAAISETVGEMRLGPASRFFTMLIFKHMLRKRAYTRESFLRMIAASPFGHGQIDESPMGFDIWLEKPGAAALSAPMTQMTATC
ncbi:MAG TPA: class I SAM-dependent methyltransferase [Rhizomicrobium sp.]|nr:class I SAM-dependent methyltransferase [Rhizomicrobium sp.]